MNIQQLRLEQHERLKAQVEKQLDYWHRLLNRLDSQRFPRDGELFLRALNAQRAVHAVWEYIEFHRPQGTADDSRELPLI